MSSVEEEEEQQPFLTQACDDKTKKRKVLNKQNEYLDNIDYNAEKCLTFYILIGLIEGTAISLICMLIYWWCKYFDIPSWFDIKKRFGFHPIMMVTGMIIALGNSAIVYRVFRNQSNLTVTVIHTFFHMMTLLLTVIGLYAAFSVNTFFNYGSMYSLHSWLGITTVSLYFIMLIISFCAFFAQKFQNDKLHKQHLLIHKFLGSVIFFMAIATAVVGITEEMLMSYMPVYPKLGAVSQLPNMIGILIMFFGILVAGVLSNNSYKRISQ